MANDNKAGAALAISIPAAIAAALALAKKTQGTGGELVLPKEFVDLVVAIAATSDDINSNTQAIIQALNELAINVQGWPQNADSITGLRVAINPPTGVQLPSIVIPSGMALVIKAWALNPAWLFVGASVGEASNINQSFYLLPSETVSYFVENADHLYIAAMTAAGVATAGCFACLTVEQRRRGGG
jgi:hypothetical protein